jgi:hypothetical protein
MMAVISWMMGHSAIEMAVLLGISEALALVFPSDSGFGGMLAGLIKALKGLGAKEPGAQ